MLKGLLSTLFVTLLSYPLDTIRVCWCMQGSESIFSVMNMLYNQGLTRFYAGIGLQLVYNIFYYVIGLYAGEEAEENKYVAASRLVTYPILMLITLTQLTNVDTVTAISTIYNKQSVAGLWKGVLYYVVRNVIKYYADRC